MNASFRPQIVPQFRGVALAIASLLLVNVRSFAQDLPQPANPATPPPVSPGAEALDAGRVAEEGDHDLEQATREYQAVLASYEALRPRAAQALFRLAEIAAKLQKTDEAQSLYSRVIQEFPTVGDLATQSQERLDALGPNQPFYAMDPVLARRYGLIPRNPPATAGFGGVSGGAANVGPGAPSAQSHGLGGGAGVASGLAAGPATPSASPYTVAITGGALDKAAILRTEAAQLSAQLRKVQREIRAIEDQNWRQIPTLLVEDPKVQYLIRACDDAETQIFREQQVVLDDETKKIKQENWLRLRDSVQTALNNYLDNIYRPRLKRTQDLLQRELDELEAAAKKARPIF